MTDTSASLAPDDPRVAFARAVALAGAVIGQVGADQQTAPTPCDAYDARALQGHLLAVLHRVAAVGRGEDAFSVPDVVEADDYPVAWTEAAHEVQRVWTDASLLATSFTLPWAALDGRALLHMYTCEITVHTWDLATATGQQPAWDDAVVATALASIQPMLPAGNRAALFASVVVDMPEGRGDFAPPYAEAVDVPAGAPLIDQLVAWTGRQP